MPLNFVAKLAITAVMTAAQMALTASQRITGPRLDDLDVTTADYGTPIPRFWGKRKFEGAPIIWSERLREVHTESKTKGGKYDEYKYYWTGAVLICDHEIESVSRIWFDKHLVYDATSTGPIAAFFGRMPDGTRSPVKIQRGRNMRIYLGTETQEPDPRIESWCEDRYGADSCPAYRGSAYIVFEEIPVEKFGNRVPQISVEAINTSTESYPYEAEDSDARLAYFSWSPDFSRFIVSLPGSDVTEVWDTATRTMLVAGAAVGGTGTGGPAIDNDGYIWATAGTLGNTLYQYHPDTFAEIASFSIGEFTDDAYAFGESIYLHPYQTLASQYIQFSGGAATVTDIPFDPTAYFEDTDGVVWAIGSVTNTLYFWSPGSYFSVTTTGTGTAAYAVDNGEGSFFCRHGNVLVLVDKETHAVTASSSVSSNLAVTATQFRGAPAGVSSMWFQHSISTVTEYSTETLAALRTISLTNWSATDVDDLVHDPINHALITAPQAANELAWRYLDRITSPGVTLESVVEDVAEWCGIDSVDASDLTQTVEGYSVTQGTGKDMLAPLLDIHDSIVRPHDFSVQFLQLGDSSLGTISTEDLVREGEARYTLTIQQDTDLPRRITLNFADIDKDQQTNTVISQRALDAVDGVRDQTLDMTTYVETAGNAQKLTDRYFRRQWNGRENARLGLTAQFLKLEPGDVYTLALDDTSRTARLDKLTIGQGVLTTEWVRDFVGLHTLGTGEGAEMEGRDNDGIFVPAPSRGFVLDIPYITDADAAGTNPLIYYAAGPYGDGAFPGANIYEQDGDNFTLWNAVESWNKASWGYATEALATARPWLWDRGNTVNINLIGGTLTSCTEADIDADQDLNLALLGNEIINFTTATLQGDGSWDISNFKRGRRGTEWARDDHATNDLFLLLSTVKSEEFGQSDIGDSFTFRATTLGREITNGLSIALTVEGNSLKPYAPVRFRAVRNTATNDWVFTWRRRTRLGGAWTGGSTIPLNEASEAYELVIPTSGSPRTITASTETATWTSAQQTTDYGSPQTTLPADIAVYQMSDVVGRGFASEEPLAA